MVSLLQSTTFFYSAELSKPVTHWDAIEYFMINAGMIAFVGYLLKHELNDIKTRIVRLENIFLHPLTKDRE